MARGAGRSQLVGWAAFLRRGLALGSVRRGLMLALAGEYALWIVYQAVRDRLWDFGLYYLAAKAFAQGIDVYALGASESGPTWAELAARYGVAHYAPPYRYPPLTALLVWPLTELSPSAAGVVWLIASAAALWLSAWLVGRSLDRPWGVGLAFGLWLLSVPALATLNAGQVNALVLLALSTALYGLTRRRWWGLGLGVAVATMLKLAPVALLGHLAWRGRWRAAAWAVLGIAVLLVLPALWWSPAQVMSYAQHLPRLGSTGELVAAVPNQSLNGVLARLLGDVLGGEAIYAVYVVSVALLVTATVAICWPPGRANRRMSLELGLIICMLQLVTPYTWYHQLVLLWIPLALFCAEMFDRFGGLGWATPLAGLLALNSVHGLAWRLIPAWPLARSTPALLTLFLWGSLALFARRAGRQSATSRPIVSRTSSVQNWGANYRK